MLYRGILMPRLARRALLALTLAVTVAAGAAQSAAARSVSVSEQWTTVEVCADSLTHHLGGGETVTLHRGHDYYIVGFADGNVRVYGYNQGGRYGWVYNGWFC
jgi:hypothetical protein